MLGEEGKVDLTTDSMIVELATALNRHESLSDRHSHWLERALRREDRRFGRQTKPWKLDDPKLRKMLAAGLRPQQIAQKLNRTPRAIYRRMYKLGLTCGKGSVARVGAGE